VVLADLRASQPRDIALRLVRAGAVLALGFAMIDPLHFEARMEIVPSSRLVSVDGAASGPHVSRPPSRSGRPADASPRRNGACRFCVGVDADRCGRPGDSLAGFVLLQSRPVTSPVDYLRWSACTMSWRRAWLTTASKLPDVTEEELAQRGEAADRLWQEIKRRVAGGSG
jgi:hypothetical protein